MEAGEVEEAWKHISRWYRQARGAQDPPITEELENITVAWVELYRCRSPEGLKVPLLVRKADNEDGIPTGAEVADAVWGLKGGRAGGPSVMQAEDLKGWLREATHTKAPSQRRWEILVRLLHWTFRDGTPPEELTWATMVLIPKGKGEFRGIIIEEVAWKVCATVVNCRLVRGLVLHEALHGFRSGRETGTATLDANSDQQLAGLAHEPLFQVFLDIHKEYDSLDRGICLEVLRGYRMGPNMV